MLPSPKPRTVNYLGSAGQYTPSSLICKVLMKVSRKEEVKERGEYCRDRIKTKGKGKAMVDSPTPLSYCNDVNSFFVEQ